MDENTKEEWRRIMKIRIVPTRAPSGWLSPPSFIINENKHVIIQDYKSKFYKLFIKLILFCNSSIMREEIPMRRFSLLPDCMVLFIYKFTWLNYTEKGLYYKAQEIKIKLNFPTKHEENLREDLYVSAKLTPAQHIFYIIKET